MGGKEEIQKKYIKGLCTLLSMAVDLQPDLCADTQLMGNHAKIQNIPIEHPQNYQFHSSRKRGSLKTKAYVYLNLLVKIS